MMLKVEPEAALNLLRNIHKERIVGRFSCPRRERRSRRGVTSLVTKTRVPLRSAWGMPLGIRFVGIMRGGGR
jgi:hypothetical protein